MKSKLIRLYEHLLEKLGPQNWWPAETKFEVIIGAILTQNTSWTNVEKAIENLKKLDILAPDKLSLLTTTELATLIKPAGYFNIKAKRISNFMKWLKNRTNYNLEQINEINDETLRDELLSINGIGNETADSIMLYAFDRPSFVVDAYTHRILVRHNELDPYVDYYQIKDYCEAYIPNEIKVFNELHALIVNVGKNWCKKKKPVCNICPVKEIWPEINLEL